MNISGCEIKLSSNILEFKKGDTFKQLPCVRDGTLQSKSMRFSHFLTRSLCFFSKPQKMHISFIVEDGKKVLIRKSDLEFFSSLSSLIDTDAIEHLDRNERLQSLANILFPTPKVVTQRKPSQRPSAQIAQRSYSIDSNADLNSIPIQSLVVLPSQESTAEKTKAVFKKYNLNWPIEGPPGSLEGKVNSLLENAISTGHPMTTIFQEKLIGYHEGTLLVGEIEKDPFNQAGAHGDICRARVTVIDENGETKQRRAVLKTPKQSEDSKSLKREWKLTKKAAEEHSAAIKPIAPVVRLEDIDFTGKVSQISSILLPLLDGNCMHYTDALLSSQISFEDRLKETLSMFKALSQGLAKHHAKEIVHNDIKMENVFVNYNKNEKGKGPIFKKAVFGDWSNGMFGPLVMTSIVTFKREYDRLKQVMSLYAEGLQDSTAKEEIKTLRKRIDVRQFAFFMYELLGAEKVLDNQTLYPGPYDLKEDEHGHDWPNIETAYKDLPKHIPKPLRSLIREMLSPDESQVPTMKIVSERLNQMNF